MEPVKMEHHVDNHQAGHRLSNDPNAVRTSLLSGYCQYQCQVRIFTKIRDLLQQDQLEDETNASGSILLEIHLNLPSGLSNAFQRWFYVGFSVFVIWLSPRFS